MSWGDEETPEETEARRICIEGAAAFVDSVGYMTDAILVFPFYDAPAALMALSRHGGDEDWLALVPPGPRFDYVAWLDYGSFGCCSISEHRLPNGWRVHIGAHA